MRPWGHHFRQCMSTSHDSAGLQSFRAGAGTVRGAGAWAGGDGGAHGEKQASGCGMMSKGGRAWSTHRKDAGLGVCGHPHINDQGGHQCISKCGKLWSPLTLLFSALKPVWKDPGSSVVARGQGILAPQALADSSSHLSSAEAGDGITK